MRFARAIVLAGAAFAIFAATVASGPSNHVASFATLFSETPFEGGQVPPRLYKWVNDDVSIFVQLDRSNPAEATTARYIGFGLKGTFCAEAQPAGPNGGFTTITALVRPCTRKVTAGSPARAVATGCSGSRPTRSSPSTDARSRRASITSSRQRRRLPADRTCRNRTSRLRARTT